MERIARYASPLGGITLASDGTALTGLWFDGQKYFGAGLSGGAAGGSAAVSVGAEDAAEDGFAAVFGEAKRWLDAYFAGRVPDFVPPLSFRGASPFRRRVWELLLRIPYGMVTTYGALAEALSAGTGVQERPCGKSCGGAVSARAVGGAVGHNPVSLIVPCHRVIGADGSLTGYAGGVEKKRALLRLEGASLTPDRSLFR